MNAKDFIFEVIRLKIRHLLDNFSNEEIAKHLNTEPRTIDFIIDIFERSTTNPLLQPYIEIIDDYNNLKNKLNNENLSFDDFYKNKKIHILYEILEEKISKYLKLLDKEQELAELTLTIDND